MPAWTCKPHADLTTAELYALLTLRSVVFVMEQNCPYLDMDGQDLQGQTQHLMAWDNGALVAYCRLLEPARNEGRAVIGRVVTAPSARGAAWAMSWCAAPRRKFAASGPASPST